MQKKLLLLITFLSCITTLWAEEKPMPPPTVKEGSPSPCQPEFFDPQTSKYTQEKDGRYKVDSNYEDWMIMNGYFKNNDAPIQVIAPYQLKYYTFGCASSYSAIIEILKDQKRQSFFTHVESTVSQKQISQNGQYLYLVNNVKKEANKWDQLTRIIDIKNDLKLPLPANDSCVSRFGFWSGNYLITYSDRNYDEYKNPEIAGNPYETTICIWEQRGHIVYRFKEKFLWMAASSWTLYSHNFGLTPKNSDIFYAVQSDIPDATGCYLYLKNLKSNEKKTIKLSSSDNWECGELIEVDLSNLKNIHDTSIKFREKESRDGAWGEWKSL